MVVDPELLEILVCPETRQPVRPADEALVDRLNRTIEEGKVKNRGGDVVEEPMDGGLVRDDGQVLYPIRDEIPVMLIDESIELEPLSTEVSDA